EPLSVESWEACARLSNKGKSRGELRVNRLAGGLVLTGYGALRPLTAARVRLRALSTHGKTTTVTDTGIGADVHLAADVCGDLASQVTFGLIVAINVFTTRNQLRLLAFIHTTILIHTGCLNCFCYQSSTNTKLVGLFNNNTRFATYVNPYDTGQISFSFTSPRSSNASRPT